MVEFSCVNDTSSVQDMVKALVWLCCILPLVCVCTSTCARYLYQCSQLFSNDYTKEVHDSSLCECIGVSMCMLFNFYMPLDPRPLCCICVLSGSVCLQYMGVWEVDVPCEPLCTVLFCSCLCSYTGCYCY